MKNINTYIIEKLKINKDSKFSEYSLTNDPNNVVKRLAEMSGYYNSGFNEDHRKKILKTITDWVNENKVEDITMYANLKDLEDVGKSKKYREMFKDWSTDEEWLDNNLSKVTNMPDNPKYKRGGMQFYYNDEFFMVEIHIVSTFEHDQWRVAYKEK